MSEHYILSDTGDPVPATMSQWAEWFESHDRVLARESVADGEVSTVFLGLDHSFGCGPPLIWETLVFGGNLDKEMDRYTTRDQALAGHKKMCERVRAASRSASLAQARAEIVDAALAWYDEEIEWSKFPREVNSQRSNLRDKVAAYRKLEQSQTSHSRPATAPTKAQR